MSHQNVTLALIQQSNCEDKKANIDKTVNHIENAAGDGAQVICLQELFNTTYFCREVDDRYFEWAESIPGPSTELMGNLAKSLGVVILAPLFERRSPGIYHNSIVVMGNDGAMMGLYRKKHIPEDPGFYEKYYFTPGEDEYQVFPTRFGHIGPLICWDQWYPEAARITALKGAQLLVYPTAIGTIAGEDDKTANEFHDAWQIIQRSHAIANGCFVASVNRVGSENGTSFWGKSFVAGPFGQIIAQAGSEEEVLIVDIDFSRIEKQRQTWPFFRDRRIDTYRPILKRYID